MTPEINFPAARHLQICNEDCIIHTTDVDNDDGEDAPSIIHNNNDVGELDINHVKDTYPNIIKDVGKTDIKIGGLDFLLHNDNFNVVNNDNDIPHLLSCTSNADIGSSGAKSTDDDAIGDDDISGDEATDDDDIGNGDHSPYNLATVCLDDIITLLRFQFNKPIYCLIDSISIVDKATNDDDIGDGDSINEYPPPLISMPDEHGAAGKDHLEADLDPTATGDQLPSLG